MNGRLVGYWTKARDGERFGYFEDWVSDPQSRPLSLSLPFTPGSRPYHGDLVTSYFDNLLPPDHVAHAIFNGLRSQCGRLASRLPDLGD